jgi:transcriptional regulator with XRE-family HTH domain
MELNILGNNLRNYRSEKNISQEKLAELSNVSRNYISMIERGEINFVSDEIIKKLSWG